MQHPKNDSKVAQYQLALSDFIDRLREDRYVLAAVLQGSLTEETVWRKNGLSLWIIEADGVTRRLKFDGEDPDIYRTFVEAGVNIHAELIPRSRFRRMIEGSSRTAFSCNFFAKRELVYCDDDSIARWFDQANSLAVTDQEKELLAVTTWIIYGHRHAHRRLMLREDLPLATQDVIGTAHSVAYLEIIRNGEVYEQEAIYRAVELQPELFQTIYLDVLAKRKTRKLLLTALDTVNDYLEQYADEHLRPLLRHLRKEARPVPLSELADHFAHTQLYPWHLESACEWLEQKGRLEKHSSPFQITKKSRVEVEEPAYFVDEM